MPGFRANNRVQVKSADEILATLDENGCLDGLPFMPEMLKYCGKEFVVFRRIDKIIDVIKMTGLRRMSKTVTLNSVRCDGHAHGGCQQGCQLLWKEEWLRRSRRSARVCEDGLRNQHKENRARETRGRSEALLVRAAVKAVESTPDEEVYRCQATELFEASSYLPWWDIRQYLSPLISGNVGLIEFLSVASISLFNWVQRLRGGCQYPYWEGSKLKKTPTARLDLKPGEWVLVKTKN
jgi:hypothetical protein